MKNCLIIGFGSIGSRHARILRELGCEVFVVSKRNDIFDYKVFKNVYDAFKEKSYDYVVISNKTSEHYDTLKILIELKYKRKILIEKPLAHENIVLDFDNSLTYVAYNLRYHPIIEILKKRFSKAKLISMHVYCGQYLPDWRPDIKYSQSYSALKKYGGGVLRDLSHELDYICWIAGEWKRVTAISGQFSDLDIETDDTNCILLQTERCPAITIQLNYLDRNARREIIINTNSESIKVDLINSTLQIGSRDIEYFENIRDLTYIKQHEDILNGNLKSICTYKEGNGIMKLIDSIENAARKKIWIENI